MESGKNRYIELAKHCIGMGQRKPYTRHGKLFYRPYRNYYASGKNHEEWDLMVDAEYAKRGEANSHGGYIYYMTRKGLDWLGKELNMHIYDESE
ncbi:MAG: hypothetical protein K2I96_04145 [Lachnospiraceae bacterium]|nr:hypothetical protein [Lachnospiraceae bacterium]